MEKLYRTFRQIKRLFVFIPLLAIGLGLVGWGVFGDFSLDSNGNASWFFERAFERGLLMLIGVAIPCAYLSSIRAYSNRLAVPMRLVAESMGGSSEHRGYIDPVITATWTKDSSRGDLAAWMTDFRSAGKNDIPPRAARWVFRYRVDFPVTIPQYRVEIRPEVFGDGFARLLGMQDLEIGLPFIDNPYIIQSSDPARFDASKEALRGPVRELQALSESGELLHVLLVPGRLVVQRAIWVPWQSRLEEQVPADYHVIVTDLLRGLTGLALVEIPTTISFVSAPGAPATAPPATVIATTGPVSCLVCGDTITADCVACDRCETPHHPDCWDYNLSCALFACGCKKSRRIRLDTSAAS